ncbi:hypothetical protein JZ751_018678, partial [Albula glossodonta]
MSNSFHLYSQMTSIMEILTKAAITEILKLVDERCAVLRLQMYKCQNERDALRRKLLLTESELRVARGVGARGSSSADVCVGLHACSQLPGEGNDDSEERPPFENKLFEDECNPQPTPAGEEQVTEPTPAGHPEEQVAQPTPVEEEKKQETGPTPAGDPEELREQHRCGHSDEELSGLEFVVKAEQEEEHVAQRLSQTGCEHSAGRLNNLGSEYV